jgi:hypothetical protein
LRSNSGPADESFARVMSTANHTELKTTNSYLKKSRVDLDSAAVKFEFEIYADKLGDVLHIGFSIVCQIFNPIFIEIIKNKCHAQ